MPINRYDLGDLVRTTAVFTNIAGTAIDPDVLVFKVKMPNGVTTEYTYLEDYQIVRDSLGNFHLDISAIQAGYWHYRWEATGVGQSAYEGQFVVEASYV